MNRRDFLKNVLIGTGIFSVAAGGGIFYYINRPEFGKYPQGERLKKILSSPHYFADHFENLIPVPIKTFFKKSLRFISVLNNPPH